MLQVRSAGAKINPSCVGYIANRHYCANSWELDTQLSKATVFVTSVREKENCSLDRQEARHPKDWLTKAQRDLARVQILLEADDPEGTGFHLQQAVEKGLKAFLLSREIIPRRIHDLSLLLDEVAHCEPDLEQFRDLCELSTDLYFPQHYSFLGVQPPTEDDIKALLAQARVLLQKIKALPRA